MLHRQGCTVPVKKRWERARRESGREWAGSQAGGGSQNLFKKITQLLEVVDSNQQAKQEPNFAEITYMAQMWLPSSTLAVCYCCLLVCTQQTTMLACPGAAASTPPPAAPPGNQPQIPPALSHSMARMGTSLLAQELSVPAPGAGLFTSPASNYLGLALALNGAGACSMLWPVTLCLAQGGGKLANSSYSSRLEFSYPLRRPAS